MRKNETRKNEARTTEGRTKEARKDLPENFNELKKSVNRTSSWRERLDAIEELGRFKSKETINLLNQRLENDPVYKIQEAAYRRLRAWGEQVIMPERKNRELIKDTNKVLVRIKKSLPEDHSYEDFKEKVKKTRMDLYDTYEGEKGPDFDKWLEEQWSAISAR
ncbi:HEAT repeat domain-containing protein [Mesobacillus foraminis]|uniref:HEAT repeat domain-containing protein n=1 Tax=Mesobacillus foraminis TaxID=279826 RepID=UPI000EF51EC1|nr:HEAT repeat domain-containing protein [Mesobacillus foraminis]